MKILVGFCLLAIPFAGHAQEKVKNAKVFPKDITVKEIRNKMFGWSADLGVRCSFCHWSPTGKFKDTEFESDKKETKETAREMFKMMNEINKTFFASRDQKMSCYTCHHGTNDPRKLEDILMAAHGEGGLQDLEKTYREMRKEYYGQGAYNFAEWTGLARAASKLYARGDIEGTKALHELNLEFNPDYDGSHSALGIYYLRVQFDLEKARDHFKKSMLGNSFWTARRLLKQVKELGEEQQIKRQKTALDLLVEIAPEFADGHFHLGLHYRQSGNPEAARAAFEKALECDPKHKDAAKALADM